MERLVSRLSRAGRPEVLLAPAGVAVGAAYARFDAQPSPGLWVDVAMLLAAWAAGCGICWIDEAWDALSREEAVSAAASGIVALIVAAAGALAIVPLVGGAAAGYGLLAALLGILRRAPVIGFDGLGWALGDVATMLALGPLAALAGFASHAGTGSAGAMIAGAPAGFVSAAVLYARHFVRREADVRLERTTPVTILGPDRARQGLLALPVLAALAVAAATASGEYPRWALVAIVPLAVPLFASRGPGTSAGDPKVQEHRTTTAALASILLVAGTLLLASPR